MLHVLIQKTTDQPSVGISEHNDVDHRVTPHRLGVANCPGKITHAST
jgi:hypothetical protein